MKKRLAKKIVSRSFQAALDYRTPAWRGHPYPKERVLAALAKIWHYHERRLGSLPIQIVTDWQQLHDDIVFRRHEWHRLLSEPCLHDTSVHDVEYGTCQFCFAHE